MARIQYDQELKSLKNQMLELGVMIEEIIQETVRALIRQDAKLAKKISDNDDRVDERVRQIEQDCCMLFLKQQPVARDLRAVYAALKMITDMERIGDHGKDISELTIHMMGGDYSEVINKIEEMSKETSVMIIEAIDAFAKESEDKARKVISRDDTVDNLFMDVKTRIADSIKGGESNAMQDLDMLMVAKYFERIGDHATNIAEWVIFAMTGELPES